MPDPPSAETAGLSTNTTEGAVASDQRQVEAQPVLVGPTTANEFNTIGERLIPKACFRFEDIRFDFDSSFVRPEVRLDLPHLADLIERHTLTLPGPPEEKLPPPLSIFGHADPVGSDDYNKQLSGRRALSVYAMLVREERIWEDLFARPLGGDQWGNKQFQTMLEAVGHSPGAIDGVMGPQTTDAVKAFQREKGLAADGIVGPQTRKALFRAYMDALCGPRLELDKQKHFLARGRDGDGLKGDVQGCSEFNPVLVLSQTDEAELETSPDKTERNRRNQPNRRVMVLLFAPGRRVNPRSWPCPRVRATPLHQAVADCKRRFFTDGETRRKPGPQERKFAETKDTFGCRFYQIITDDSPCERWSLLIREALWITALPSDISDRLHLALLDEHGVEIGRIPATQVSHRLATFDLSGFDAHPRLHLELHGEGPEGLDKRVAPLLELRISRLRRNVALGTADAVRSEFFPPAASAPAAEQLQGEEDVVVDTGDEFALPRPPGP